MKKRKADDWFPFWIDKWLFGSTRIELLPDERGCFVDLMALSKKDEGWIRANEGVPYLTSQLCGVLNVEEELLLRTIQKCLEFKKIKKYKDGTLYMTSHEGYKLSPRHKRRFEGHDVPESGHDVQKTGRIYIKEEENKYKDKDKIVIPDWIPSKEFKDFQKMRKTIKKPMTDRAIELAVKKLETLKSEGHDPKLVLEQSTFNSWQGLFPLKDDRKEYKPSQIGKSAKKTTPENEEYYAARRKKEDEMRVKYRKEMEEIQKRGDKQAFDEIQEKMDEEVREWSRGYLEERGA